MLKSFTWCKNEIPIAHVKTFEIAQLKTSAIST